MQQIQEIDIQRFFTKYVPDPEAPEAMKAVDYVAYGPRGALDRTVTVERISRLQSVQGGEDTDNLAVQLARYRWDMIRPRYEAWKEGREMPVDGVPLAAFAALSPEDIDLLHINKVHTVEQLASMPDRLVQKLALPNVRALMEQAKMFLANADRTAASARMTQIEDENRALRARLEEIEKATSQKRGPGRPPKAVAEPADGDFDGSAVEAA